MALSGAVSWNPLRCSGTTLPANVLLMAKLIALALLATNHVALLPDPFLPFVPWLEQIPGPLFQGAVRVVFVGSALALLLNRAVRLNCLLLGGSILLSVLASRAYFGNNKTFCALMLILAGLLPKGAEPLTLRMQVAIVYFGAGLNKALEPDWHSGQFFEHWAGERLQLAPYQWVSAMLPPLVAGKIMCWVTIALELGAAVCLLIPGLRWWGAAASILLQSGFLLFTGTTFTMFFYGMQAAMFAFLPWPRKPVEVIYDGDCGFCDWCREQITRFDFDRVFVWHPYQMGLGKKYGISDEQAQRRLQLVTPEGRVLEGFHAVRRMLFYLPVVWMAFFAAIALAPPPQPIVRRVLVALMLWLISPLANPIGVWLYDLVARNRHRLFPGRACALPQGPRPVIAGEE